MTKEDALNDSIRQFHHKTLRNSDKTPVRCRKNGKCITWKTRPTEFKLPVKVGLRGTGYLTERNASEWCSTVEEALNVS
jgi:hypothetical protein